MIDRNNFKLSLLRSVVWTPEHSAFNSGKAIGTVLSRFQDRYNGEMQVVPLPAEVPVEVDRVVLQSADTRRRFSLGPARMDSRWQTPDVDKAFDVASIARECVEVQRHLVEATKLRVARMSLVVQRIYHTSEPAQELVAQFCKAEKQVEPFNHSRSFEIHNHKVYSPTRPGMSVAVNSWVRCKSARVVADARPVIQVEQDINTLAEDVDQRRFTGNDIERFMASAVEEADEILKKYFP